MKRRKTNYWSTFSPLTKHGCTTTFQNATVHRWNSEGNVKKFWEKQKQRSQLARLFVPSSGSWKVYLTSISSVERGKERTRWTLSIMPHFYGTVWSQHTIQNTDILRILLHGNARPHTAEFMHQMVYKFDWEMLEDPPYSPDLSPCDYHIFRPFKDALGGQHFPDDDDDAVEVFLCNWFEKCPKEFFKQGMKKLRSAGKNV